VTVGDLFGEWQEALVTAELRKLQVCSSKRLPIKFPREAEIAKEVALANEPSLTN
jgi:hypothetical protein